MSNADTVQAITGNLLSVLRGLGLTMSIRPYDSVEAFPATTAPGGDIFYGGEAFEYNFGEKPKYAEAAFEIRIIAGDRDPEDQTRNHQVWVHKVREALTVNGLNIGSLASSKLISQVRTEGVAVQNKDAVAVLTYQVKIRYREV